MPLVPENPTRDEWREWWREWLEWAKAFVWSRHD
jgi:hypothetical protein